MVPARRPAAPQLRAPPAGVQPSKRVPVIEDVEHGLDKELVTLEEDTRRANREFYEQLDDFKLRTQRWEAKLKAEVLERDEAHQQILDSFQVLLRGEMQKVAHQIQATFDRFEGDLCPPAEERVGAVEEDLGAFVQATVPDVIEREQKAMEEKIKAAREGFDIENAKVKKRENRIGHRFEEHQKRTAQTFADTTATRVAKLALLREDLEASQRSDDREEEARLGDMMAQIKDIKERTAAMTKAREEHDCQILDSVLESQVKLQDSIIENFGANSELDFEAEP